MRRPAAYRAVRTAVLAVVGMSLISPPLASANPAKSRIRLATLLPSGTSYHHILQEMGENWRKATGGEVLLTIYPDGTMGSEAEMVRRMRVGQLQAATLSVTGLSEIDPSVSALQKMPMMFRSLDEVEYVRSKLTPELDRRLLEKGFVVLCWGDAGWVRFFSRERAERPHDFKKMKMFVGAGDNSQVDIMKAAGYRPVPLEWSDALTGFQTGLIDAAPTVPFHALANQYYTVARHLLEVNWVPLVGATVITKRAWDALPPPWREALAQAAAEAGRKIQARSREESNESVEAMKKRGLQVHAISPALEAEWRRVAEEFYPKIRGAIVPAEMFDEVQRLLAGYRTSPAGGTK